MRGVNRCHLAIVAIIATYLALSTFTSASSTYNLDIPSPDAIAALQTGDSEARNEVIQRLETLFRSLSGNENSKVASGYDYGGLGPSKRQNIRYHQCYFNPISCFRRRK